MPRYETSFPIAWRLRRLNATLRDLLLHGLAIKGVKCHGTQPASLHGLAIKGAQCHGTLPTFYHGQSIQVVKFRY